MRRSIALLLGLAVIMGACGSEEAEPGIAGSTVGRVAESEEFVDTTETTDPPEGAPAPEADDEKVSSAGATTLAPHEEGSMTEDPAELSNPEKPPTSIDPSLAGLIAEAITDLAARRSMAESDIAVVTAELVVWPNAALGCPHPDMRYKQVPEDGARIVLEAGGITYAYHTGGSRGLFLCEQPAKSKPPTPTLDLGPDA